MKTYLIIGAVLLGGLFLSGIYAKGRADGKASCESAYAEREKKAIDNAIEREKKQKNIRLKPRSSKRLADLLLDGKA